MARIAVLHASFLGGGAEAVCLWTLQALKADHEISLITFADVDFSSLNQYYGTQLASSDITLAVGYLGSRMMKQIRSNTVSFTLRQHLLSRFFKPHAHQYAVCFSTFNEMDFGRRGIQYIHYPMFSTGRYARRTLTNQPDSAVRRIFRKGSATITGFGERQARRNVTLVNSRWTAGVIEEAWGVTPRVIYPPVPSAYRPVAWDDRLDSFLCISRIVPEKQIERAVRIIDGVRRRGFEVRLRLIGGTRLGCSSRYYDQIRRLQETRQDWLVIEHDLSREELSILLTSYKYGLHVRENEQFGIAVAEMVLAGCIPFVPNAGGQAEIVGGNPLLTFATERDAVDKIVAVLSNRRLQEDLRLSLINKRRLFSEHLFMDTVRETVADFARDSTV